jgi:hypothetical protein
MWVKTISRITRYFAAIDEEMDNGGREALLHYLLKLDLGTVNLRIIPRTAALLEQQIATATPEQAWWFDTLNRGVLPGGVEGDPSRCFKQQLFEDYVHHASQQGARRKQIETKLGMFLRKYVGPALVTERDDEAGEARQWFYRFPPLAECRRRFAQMLRQDIPWDGDHDDEWAADPRSVPERERPF